MGYRVYEITYDLHVPGQNYSAVEQRINEVKSGGGRVMQSTWLITSKHTVVQIRDHIKQSLDANDKIVVAQITEAAWSGLSSEWSKWLKESVANAPA